MEMFSTVSMDPGINNNFSQQLHDECLNILVEFKTNIEETCALFDLFTVCLFTQKNFIDVFLKDSYFRVSGKKGYTDHFIDFFNHAVDFCDKFSKKKYIYYLILIFLKFLKKLN